MLDPPVARIVAFVGDPAACERSFCCYSEARLVLLYSEHVVRAALGQEPGVLTLGVQRVSGHDDIGEVDGSEKWTEDRGK